MCHLAFPFTRLALFLHVLIFRAGLPIGGPSNQFRWTQGRKKRRIHIPKVPQQHKPTHAPPSPSAPVFSNRVFSGPTGWGRSTAVYSPRISPACFELRSEPRFHSCWFPTPSHPSPPPEGCSAPKGEAGTRRVGAPCGSRGVAQTETPRALLHQQSGWTRHQLLIPKTPKPKSSTPHVRPQGWPPASRHTVTRTSSVSSSFRSSFLPAGHTLGGKVVAESTGSEVTQVKPGDFGQTILSVPQPPSRTLVRTEITSTKHPACPTPGSK